MRASDLLDRPVVDARGRRIGIVTDLRATTRGTRPGAGSVPRVVVTSLLVDRRARGPLFGYERGRQRGPAMLRGLTRLLHASAILVPWDDVADCASEVRLRGVGPWPNAID